MFTRDEKGSLNYISERTKQVYSLLEGIDNANLTSDIVFIYKEPLIEIDGVEYETKGAVVGWSYGGFRSQKGRLPKDELDYIEDEIKKYENEEYFRNE